MIKKIRNSKASKIIVFYLAITMIFQVVAPVKAYALTEGPSQPEFNSFTPIGTSDMVNLSTGDFNYNIPIMDVGGYPLNLSYDSGVTMDQEASWVGLGWNLNVGQINRDVRGIPDDFNGDEIQYENNLKTNKTVGMVFNVNPQLAGLEAANLGMNAGLTVEYNNYEGITFKPSYGFSFELANNVQVGMNLTSSATEGVSVSPNISFSARKDFNTEKYENSLSSGNSIGLGYNSRQGLTSFTLSSTNKANIGSKKFGANGHGDVSFVTNTFTPTKRVGFRNTNFMFSFSAGTDFWSIDLEAGITAYGSFQEIRDKDVKEKAYGYENTQRATENDILDFNRENDRPISKNSMVLPVVNYTHDMYAIQSQGIGGTFRAFRGQAGYVYDQNVDDDGASESLGGEIEGATGFHVGFDYKHAPSESHTGVWNTIATPYFKQDRNSSIDYEPVYFKSIGEQRVDAEAGLLTDRLGGYDPIALKINGAQLGKYAGNQFNKQTYNLSGTPFINTSTIDIYGKLKRSNREVRNQVIQKITKAEANKYNINSSLIKVNPNAKDHHTAAIKVLNTDGTTHIFGEAAYNIIKKEASFAVRGNGDCKTGKVAYTTTENSLQNNSSIDNYFNRITTPEYAHTYLLTAILSPDYEDLTGNGLSTDDLGSFTKFKYVQRNTAYNWRTPYSNASYNAGLNSHPQDQRGSYVYGKKELKYIQTIETKTHVAYFKLSERNDGLGVMGEDGGKNLENRMYKLDKIYLFSKPEFEQFRSRLGNINASDDPTHAEMAKFCIKIAHFTYQTDVNKQLCKKIENTDQTNGGKLTLSKVHFTYRNSNMGQFAPYVFNYDSFNPDYHIKSYDFWGYYKPIVDDVDGSANNGVIKRVNNAVKYQDANLNNPIPELNPAYQLSCDANYPTVSTPEFPFVQQEDKKLQDAYASAWSLTSIDLPSGGRIELSYETDDYKYVQDRKAMQMVKIIGAGAEGRPTTETALINNLLYKINGNDEAKYLYVKIPSSMDPETFKQKYIGKNIDNPIYFNFMLNMSKQGGTNGGQGNEFDYVSGYFNIDAGRAFETFSVGNSYYASIPMKYTDLEGGINGQANVNPISKAGWYFGRANLNKLVYGLDLDIGDDIESIARALNRSIESVSEIFTGPNGRLRDEFFIARRFIPAKSWIRLQHPGNKLGGGVRVKKVVMVDNWNVMLNVPDADKQYYTNSYGQEYKYTLEDGITSSGVATYEPIGNKENPFVEPFYDKPERLVAPSQMNYVEKPFGESFYPAPVVTYSRVEVKDITPPERTVGNKIYEVKKHATGTIVTEFYTSRDFPTRTVFTELDDPENYYSNEGDFAGEFMKSLIGAKITTETDLTLSQGFVVHTNDMNGKEKSQQVYNSAGARISKTESLYSTDSSDRTKLNNQLPVIKSSGQVVTNNEIGVHYDVVTDFRESKSKSEVFGVQGNVAGFVLFPVPVIIPMAIPDHAQHTSTLHTTTTTKVIHTTGILKEKIVYDLGSRVSTKNLAWDSKTGEVLLTETINEYDDKYYSFSFPAYWAYKGMDMASENIDITGAFVMLSTDNMYWRLSGYSTGADLSKYLKPGDELFADINGNATRLWVVEYNPAKTGVRLMNRQGMIIDPMETSIKFRVYRSGNRNMQNASMTSVTLMKNPIADFALTNADFAVVNGTPINDNKRIINASAIEFSELWAIQCENNLPNYSIKLNTDGSLLYDSSLHFNPYVYNLLGEWRAVKSYAYLTSRNSNANSSPRNEGFFKKFSLFYQYDSSALTWKKVTTDADWTFASEISQFSPFGPELENRDALGRYSAAQYGYSYKLPVAVGSNTKYSEMGFDGFEDYSSLNGHNPHFAFSDVLNQNVWISSNASHTGKKSIAIQPGKKATLVKKINGCKTTPQTAASAPAHDTNSSNN
jgi:hypothetical protein